jgi:glycosyltransferase involved in cell wall biosynthesis
MAKLSILIPCRNEPYLKKMVDDIFVKASGEIEVIVVLDGLTIHPLPDERPNLVFIKKPVSEGLRPAINDAAKIATGKYIMKADAHVAFASGFDEELQKDCEDNWIVIPRRYDLDPIEWKPIPNTDIDYYYLGFPWGRPDFIMSDLRWFTRAIGRKDIMIDDTMTFGGSVWFTSKDHFNNLGGMSSEGYGTFNLEQHELGLKTWLGGGRVVVNKNTWYAHFGQDYRLRPYHNTTDSSISMGVTIQAGIWSTHYWIENKWKDRIHDFDWLVEKFWPLPTPGHRTGKERHTWPLNWRDYYEGRITELCGLANKYGSDKCPPTHQYTPRYFEVLKDKRDLIKKVLEIGVGNPETMTHIENYTVGASLRMWRDFFPNAQVYGADNDPAVMFKDDRIETFLVDQRSKKDLENLIAKIGNDIDLVIDDGSHLLEDQIFSCKTLMPLLKKDVIYVVEDIADHNALMQGLSDYDCEYKMFKEKSGFTDRLVFIKHKNE